MDKEMVHDEWLQVVAKSKEDGTCLICGESCEVKEHRTYAMCKKHETALCLSEDLKDASDKLQNAIEDTIVYRVYDKILKFVDGIWRSLVSMVEILMQKSA